jgi:hypothetical protein
MANFAPDFLPEFFVPDGFATCVVERGRGALGLHPPDEIRQVAAVRLHRVVRLQRIADPGDQRRRDGRGVATGSLQGAGQEGGDLLRGRGLAIEEVAALGHEGQVA